MDGILAISVWPYRHISSNVDTRLDCSLGWRL